MENERVLRMQAQLLRDEQPFHVLVEVPWREA